MRYVFAFINKEDEEKAYRYYVTDCLKMISHNTAATLRQGGQYTTLRFYELIEKKQQAKTESGDEIAARVILAVTGGTK